MWAVCKPKSENDYTECACMGKNLNRLMQPGILSVLTASTETLHGYVIVQKLAESPMFGGTKPDATGVYRTLKQMEQDELVHSSWDTSAQGPAKKRFEITEKGSRCLSRWVDTLACYQLAIGELRAMVCDSLGISVPDAPQCGGHQLD
ncbi:MAG: PadR family transcriptional regulator [Actinobacteria bacterium]|nr:PadR family transcriptional regulator [Actinomycetota bacterium]